MGILRKLNQRAKAEKQKGKAYKLSKSLQEFYAKHLVSAWQRGRVDDIRKMYEWKQNQLDAAHDFSSSRLSEEFMQYELDYLYASDQFKQDNPGMEWHPKGIKGVFKKAFWSNLIKRGMKLGIKFKQDEQRTAEPSSKDGVQK